MTERNDPCPCGSKKADGTPIKYKNCCGKNAIKGGAFGAQPKNTKGDGIQWSSDRGLWIRRERELQALDGDEHITNRGSGSSKALVSSNYYHSFYTMELHPGFRLHANFCTQLLFSRSISPICSVRSHFLGYDFCYP